jgi:hypothetical protein
MLVRKVPAIDAKTASLPRPVIAGMVDDVTRPSAQGVPASRSAFFF